jgi:DNA modification methylase
MRNITATGQLVDSIITDPPYEIALKSWHATGVAHDVATWIAAYDALKPGGYLLAFSAVRTQHRMTCAIEAAGFEIRDVIVWQYASGFPKSKNLDGEWQGWGSSLKPSYEPVVIARKPFTGTLTANVLKHGTGALNIDACRVGDRVGVKTQSTGVVTSQNTAFNGPNYGREAIGETVGRWPANTITTDLDEPWAKYFFQAKPSKKERGEGNNHPTVKPIALMEYLCKLVTPPGGTVLDCFMGSGSTGVASLQAGFDFIGLELDPGYAAIADKRLSNTMALEAPQSATDGPCLQ